MADSNLFVDIVIIAMYVLMAAAIGVILWSVWRMFKNRGSDDGSQLSTSRHTRRIGYIVASSVLLLLLVTYALGSTRPLMSNGQVFDNAQWLRLTDMFIYTSLILIFACSAVVVIARFRR
jgi:NADH:ubiquinone oxidoreductase subunit 6 (subunit J)